VRMHGAGRREDTVERTSKHLTHGKWNHRRGEAATLTVAVCVDGCQGFVKPA